MDPNIHLSHNSVMYVAATSTTDIDLFAKHPKGSVSDCLVVTQDKLLVISDGKQQQCVPLSSIREAHRQRIPLKSYDRLLVTTATGQTLPIGLPDGSACSFLKNALRDVHRFCASRASTDRASDIVNCPMLCFDVFKVPDAIITSTELATQSLLATITNSNVFKVEKNEFLVYYLPLPTTDVLRSKLSSLSSTSPYSVRSALGKISGKITGDVDLPSACYHYLPVAYIDIRFLNVFSLVIWVVIHRICSNCRWKADITSTLTHPLLTTDMCV